MGCGLVWLSRYKTSKDQRSVFILESPSVSLYRGDLVGLSRLKRPVWNIITGSSGGRQLSCCAPAIVLLFSQHDFTGWMFLLGTETGTFLACT